MSPVISPILHHLEQEYGLPPWQPRFDPLSELVLGILSQNTSDRNSRPAFLRLRARFPHWDDLLEANVEDVASAIRSAGLFRIKAQRLKLVLSEIRREHGSLELGFICALPWPEAMAWLERLPGVGPKTAAIVLLFSCGKPVLPVDTHVYRVSKRLGLVNSAASRERAQELLQTRLFPEAVYPFHVLLLEHGRRVCRARQPLCSRCVLAEDCPRAFPQEELKAQK